MRGMSGWGEYLAAWACFLGAHMIPALPGPRGWLVARLGRRGYLVGIDPSVCVQLLGAKQVQCALDD